MHGERSLSDKSIQGWLKVEDGAGTQKSFPDPTLSTRLTAAKKIKELEAYCALTIKKNQTQLN